MTLSRWLARLSFSFFILAFVLFWEFYKSSQDTSATSSATRTLYFIAAIACLTLGLIGTRIRHRND
jgi:hypothetical protein